MEVKGTVNFTLRNFTLIFQERKHSHNGENTCIETQMLGMLGEEKMAS